MNDDTFEKTLIVIGLLIVLLVSGALFVVAIHLGATLVSTWVLVIFQVLLSLAAVLAAVVLASIPYGYVVKRLSSLETRYPALTKRLAQRRPTFVSTATIVAAMVTLLSDKAFGEENVAAVCVGTLLIVFFWVANELLVAGTRFLYTTGVAIWLIAILLTPAVMLIQVHGDVSKLVRDILLLNPEVLAVIVISVILSFVAPLLLKNVTELGS